MSYEMSALDMQYLVKELQVTVGARVDKIYNPKKKELLLQLFLTGLGKKIIRFEAPGFMYMTDFKDEQPERPSGFCTMLRKYLENSRLASIAQLGFERIIELEFEAKEEKFKLIFELFSKGNIVFCRADHAIIAPVENQEWKGRSVKPKVKYTHPTKEFNFNEMGEKEFGRLAEKLVLSKKSLVKFLAVELGLGGIYSEELCSMAGVQKEKESLEKEDIKRLLEAKSRLVAGKPMPRIYFSGGAIKTISPIILSTLEGLEAKEFSSYNEALDYSFTNELVRDSDVKRLSKHQGKIDRLKSIISKQEAYLAELEQDMAQDSKKGEAIYSNYQLITEIVAELNKARKKYSLKEMKEMLAGHKVVKDIKEKEKVAVIDID
jgi:predicted ribosome quality control (RQC) complex YloA/Tae2 family protein